MENNETGKGPKQAVNIDISKYKVGFKESAKTMKSMERGSHQLLGRPHLAP